MELHFATDTRKCGNVSRPHADLCNFGQFPCFPSSGTDFEPKNLVRGLGDCCCRSGRSGSFSGAHRSIPERFKPSCIGLEVATGFSQPKNTKSVAARPYMQAFEVDAVASTGLKTAIWSRFRARKSSSRAWRLLLPFWSVGIV